VEHRPETRAAGLVRQLALVAIAGLVFGAGAQDARAVAFGPLALVAPSDVGGQPLAGTLAGDVASIPVVSPSELRLTDVSISGGGATITLDPTLLSPALGVVQPGGSFTIPTLFLRIDDGVTAFDLGIPNVTGSLSFGPGGDVIGLASSFEIDTGNCVVLARITAEVPEPGTTLLVALGLSFVATRSRARQEIAR
jgi:hypothetical protein